MHGFLLVPFLVQTEGYFREIAPGLFLDCDVDQEWDLLRHSQAHRPAGVTRLLDVIIDETALTRVKRPEVMTGQLCRLLELADSAHAKVRVIPEDAVFFEGRGYLFDVLSYAGTADRIGVGYYPVLGAELVSGGCLLRSVDPDRGDLGEMSQSRAILERHSASL